MLIMVKFKDLNWKPSVLSNNGQIRTMTLGVTFDNVGELITKKITNARYLLILNYGSKDAFFC